MSIADKLKRIAENEQAVFDAGKKSEYDTFWDSYQENGNKISYRLAFFGSGWNDTTFRPKYPMKMYKGQQQMQAFYYFRGTHIDVDIDFRAVGNAQVFQSASLLKTISKLIVTDEVTYTNWFAGCTALEDITIEGTIGNDISFSDCALLTKGSIESIIDALSGTVTGKTLTVNAAAKQAAFTDSEWAVLIGTKPNWTISLV
ncbi:MAG: hypothetical protein EGR97_12935 [Clostridiales bacterium]|jgi:hypothetical protein|nr:hypothetical protein [Clostridiales bacterium]